MEYRLLRFLAIRSSQGSASPRPIHTPMNEEDPRSPRDRRNSEAERFASLPFSNEEFIDIEADDDLPMLDAYDEEPFMTSSLPSPSTIIKSKYSHSSEEPLLPRPPRSPLQVRLEAHADALKMLSNGPGCTGRLLHRRKSLLHPIMVRHLQLRNLLVSPSPNTLVFHSLPLLRSWNIRSDVSKDVAFSLPTASSPLSTAATGLNMIVLTLAATQDHVFLGGLDGEIAVVNTANETANIRRNYSEDSNRLMNGLTIAELPEGQTLFASCNDMTVRAIDTANMDVKATLQFPWAVNYATASPHFRLLAAVGDSKTCLLSDVRSGSPVCDLIGHDDHTFACTWSPDGLLLATGGQDRQSLLFDIRNPSRVLFSLPASVEAVRSLHFAPNGRHLYAAESHMFVKVWDAQSGEEVESIEVPGHIAGVALMPAEDDVMQMDSVAVSFVSFEMKTQGVMVYHPVRDETRMELIL